MAAGPTNYFLLKNYTSTISKLFQKEIGPPILPTWPSPSPRAGPCAGAGAGAGRVAGGQLLPVQFPLPGSLSSSPTPRATSWGKRLRFVCRPLRLSPGDFCSDRCSTWPAHACRCRGSPSCASCFLSRPPAWRRPHLTLSPRELPVLLQASPEVPRPAGACAGPCGTGCHPLPLSPPAPRAPEGRGQVVLVPGGSQVC